MEKSESMSVGQVYAWGFLRNVAIRLVLPTVENARSRSLLSFLPYYLYLPFAFQDFIMSIFIPYNEAMRFLYR